MQSGRYVSACITPTGATGTGPPPTLIPCTDISVSRFLQNTLHTHWFYLCLWWTQDSLQICWMDLEFGFWPWLSQSLPSSPPGAAGWIWAANRTSAAVPVGSYSGWPGSGQTFACRSCPGPPSSWRTRSGCLVPSSPSPSPSPSRAVQFILRVTPGHYLPIMMGIP